jgi:hypothetical protein
MSCPHPDHHFTCAVDNPYLNWEACNCCIAVVDMLKNNLVPLIVFRGAFVRLRGNEGSGSAAQLCSGQGAVANADKEI